MRIRKLINRNCNAASPAGLFRARFDVVKAGVELGTVVTLERSDVELTVVGFTEGQATFGHVDVAYLPVDTWRLLAAGAAEPGAPTQ